MKLGLQLGYWGVARPSNGAESVTAAENAGYDAVFTAEAWGSDAFTPLAWWGGRTLPPPSDVQMMPIRLCALITKSYNRIY